MTSCVTSSVDALPVIVIVYDVSKFTLSGRELAASNQVINITYKDTSNQVVNITYKDTTVLQNI